MNLSQFRLKQSHTIGTDVFVRKLSLLNNLWRRHKRWSVYTPHDQQLRVLTFLNSKQTTLV